MHATRMQDQSPPESRAHEGLTASSFEERALLFKALAHPTRLAIVAALSDGELSVLDLREIVGSDTSTVSRHLLQLKTVGVLGSRRQGKQVLYRLRTPCVLTVMGCVAAMVGDEAPQGVAGESSPATPCGAHCRPPRTPTPGPSGVDGASRPTPRA